MPAEMTLEEYHEWLENLANNVGQDWSTALHETIPVFQADMLEHFETQEGPDGVWPPHAEATIARWGNHNLLVLEGDLAAAATGEGSGSIIDIDANSITYGVDASVIPYAWAQQAGREDHNLPARPYIWLSEEALEKITIIVGAFGLKQFE